MTKIPTQKITQYQLKKKIIFSTKEGENIYYYTELITN